MLCNVVTSCLASCINKPMVFKKGTACLNKYVHGRYQFTCQELQKQIENWYGPCIFWKETDYAYIFFMLQIPFGYTRKDVLLIGVGVTVIGIGLKSGLEVRCFLHLTLGYFPILVHSIFFCVTLAYSDSWMRKQIVR